MSETNHPHESQSTQDTPPPISAAELKGPKELHWAAYRELADSHAVGVRKVGLLDEGLAKASLQDERTLTVMTSAGDTPVLVPVEYAAGFDVERSRQIANENTGGDAGEVYYFCLPPGTAQNTTERQNVISALQELQDKKASIYFDFVETNPVSRDELLGFLQEAGLQGSEVPLRDERAAEGYQDVTINCYKVVLGRIEHENQPTFDSIYDAYMAGCEAGEFEKYPANGPTILKAADMSQELIDQLWGVYQDRFEWLGENHPISMEENKEEFEQLLLNPDTTASIYFKDGEPVCWTYFMSDPDAEYWLQREFIEEHTNEGDYSLFFPGIVAKPDNLGGYSEPTIKLPATMMARTSVTYSVMFETTNMSEQYIPRLVKQYVEETGGMWIDEPERLDNTRYNLVEVG